MTEIQTLMDKMMMKTLVFTTSATHAIFFISMLLAQMQIVVELVNKKQHMCILTGLLHITKIVAPHAKLGAEKHLIKFAQLDANK
jgi:hypothetical protein